MPSIIPKNIAMVRERIEKAARRAGRDPREITILAATKSVDIRKMQEAVKAGVTTFGENYVQEAEKKIKDLQRSKKDIYWHFIGHLQKNKAKDVVKLFDTIESVDS